MTYNDQDPGDGTLNQHASTYDVSSGELRGIRKWWKRMSDWIRNR